MFLYDLTHDLTASEGYTFPVEVGTIRIQLTFKVALKESIACLLYLEYDNSVRIDSWRIVTIEYKK
jgi:hypothetical protein